MARSFAPLLTTMQHRARRLGMHATVAAGAMTAFSSPVLALPTGGEVAQGTASITTGANRVDIHQASDRAVINWQGFDILHGETTQFHQPDTGSIALNRIHSQNPSQILGTLTANGRVFLVNPNGIFFGAGSKVDVAGLVASTAGISDQNFMNATNRFVFDQAGRADASIINKGTITAAQGGLVALVAPGVKNDGIISARLGTAVLGGAETFTMDFYGDNLVSFTATKAVTQKAKDENGNDLTAAVSNSGNIEGAQIFVTANVAKNVLDNVINMDGVAQATHARQEGGVIILDGGNSGKVRVSGKLDASGKASAQKGGTVKVLGDNVQLTNSAVLDVSGAAGGGVVRVGGGFQGGEGLFASSQTLVSKGAVINANATENGNGGNVVVWSNGITDFFGSIEAKGGAVAGNGGAIEVSGKSELGFYGKVDGSAANGALGTLLLDPTVAKISNFYVGDTEVLGERTISQESLADSMRTLNVTITADNSIDLTSNVDVSTSLVPSSATTAGNLTLETKTINLDYNLKMGTGALALNAATVNLTGKVTGSDNLALTSAKLSGTASEVNIKGDTASINQGISVSAAGATVTVAQGYYYESVDVNKANITLQGAKAGVAGTDGSRGTGESFIVPNSPGIHVTADGVTVDGFTIQNADNGVWVDNADNVTVKNNVITKSTSQAIYVDNSNNATITGNAIDGAVNDGILFSSVTGGVAESNNIKNITRTLPEFGSGIQVLKSTGVTVGGVGKGNTIAHTAWDGIRVGGGSNITVANNSIDDAVRVGVFLGTVSGATVDGNIITNIQTNTGKLDGAIRTISGSNLTISNNIINGSESTGIYIDNPTGLNAVTGNKINNTKSDGIYVFKANGKSDYTSGISINGNFIGKAGFAKVGTNAPVLGNGVSIVDSDYVKVNTNTIEDVAGIGVFVDPSLHASVSGNTITGSGSDGVSILESDYATVSGNDIHDNKAAGVNVTKSSSVFVTGNTLVANKQGVSADNATKLTVGNNTISGNSAEAVRISSSANVVVDGNRVSNNSYGIVLNNSASSLIKANIIDAITKGSGIDLTKSASATVSGNYIGFVDAGKTAGAVDNIKGDGVTLTNSDNGVVKGNIITQAHSTKTAFGSGVQIIKSANAIVGGLGKGEANIITNTGWDGVRIDGGSKASVIGNKIDNVVRVGVYLGYVAGATVDGNIITRTNLVNDAGIRSINGSNLTISNNKINGSAGQGIYVDNAHGLNYVTGNSINNTKSDGIRIFNTDGNSKYSSGVNVNGNRIGSAGYVEGVGVEGQVLGNGVSIIDSNYANVGGNIITDVAKAGVFIDPSLYASVSGNTITGNATGVRVEDNSHFATISGNIINENDYNGVEIDYSNDAVIRGNSISYNGQDGVNLNSAQRVSFTGNNIDWNERHGINAYASNDATVSDNQITYNGNRDEKFFFGLKISDSSEGGDGDYYYEPEYFGDGIHLEYSNNWFIGVAEEETGNNISNNVRHGVYAFESSNTTVTGNLIAANGYYQSKFYDEGDWSDEGDSEIYEKSIWIDPEYRYEAFYNGGDGVHFASNSDNGRIFGNLIVANADNGVNIISSDVSTITGNVIFDNRVDGVTLYDAQNTLITNNSIDWNGRHGINAYDSHDATVSGNQITYNGNYGEMLLLSKLSEDEEYVRGDGIHLESSNNWLIADENDISDNVRHGVYALQSTNTTVSGNTINGNGYTTGYAYEGGDEDSIDARFFEEEVRSYHGGDGVHLVNSTGSLVSNNGIAENADNGVSVIDSNSVTVSGNSISDNGNYGVFVDPSLNVVISGNNITGNIVGVRVENASHNAQINNNTISGNDVAGVEIDNSNSAFLSSNTISSNGLIGVSVSGSNNTRFASNAITNHGTGVRISNSNATVFTGDSISNNGFGVDLNNGTNSFIDSVTFTNNNEAIRLFFGSTALVRNTTISGGNVGVRIDGATSEMQFVDNGSRFSGMNFYFIVQNAGMFGKVLDASQQTFDGVRANDFTLEQLIAAEAKTTDLNDDLSLGDVFYKAFPSEVSEDGSGLDFGDQALNDFQRNRNQLFRTSLFSYAGQTIASTTTEVRFNFQVAALNLSLLGAPDAGVGGGVGGGTTPPAFNVAGATPEQLAGIATAAGPDQLAAISPAAGAENNCVNSYLGNGYNINFNAASCSLAQ